MGYSCGILVSLLEGVLGCSTVVSIMWAVRESSQGIVRAIRDAYIYGVGYYYS